MGIECNQYYGGDVGKRQHRADDELSNSWHDQESLFCLRLGFLRMLVLVRLEGGGREFSIDDVLAAGTWRKGNIRWGRVHWDSENVAEHEAACKTGQEDGDDGERYPQ